MSTKRSLKDQLDAPLPRSRDLGRPTTHSPFRRIDTVFLPIWRQAFTQPHALEKRLARIEATCVQILIEAKCWDSETSDIILGAYFAVKGSSDQETLDGLVGRRATDAAHCLHATRKLRKALREASAQATEVIPVAMLVEGCATRMGLEPLLAKELKFRRLQSSHEKTRQWFSSFLYLMIRQVCSDSDLGRSSELEVYERAAAEGSDGEVYRPRTKHAFRQQLTKWRKNGLI